MPKALKEYKDYKEWHHENIRKPFSYEERFYIMGYIDAYNNNRKLKPIYPLNIERYDQGWIDGEGDRLAETI